MKMVCIMSGEGEGRIFWDTQYLSLLFIGYCICLNTYRCTSIDILNLNFFHQMFFFFFFFLLMIRFSLSAIIIFISIIPTHFFWCCVHRTWRGPAWSPAQSLSSVLMSIQSLMNEKPYHNEPGFEQVRVYFLLLFWGTYMMFWGIDNPDRSRKMCPMCTVIKKYSLCTYGSLTYLSYVYYCNAKTH